MGRVFSCGQSGIRSAWREGGVQWQHRYHSHLRARSFAATLRGPGTGQFPLTQAKAYATDAKEERMPTMNANGNESQPSIVASPAIEAGKRVYIFDTTL